MLLSVRPGRRMRPSFIPGFTPLLSLITNNSSRQASNMATPYRIHVVPEDTGLWKQHQNADAAKKATDLLQQDLKEHHVFFNNDGFHNHIVHHILAMYGTGATPEQMQKGYNDNKGYQRDAMEPHDKVPEELQDWDHA